MKTTNTTQEINLLCKRKGPSIYWSWNDLITQEIANFQKGQWLRKFKWPFSHFNLLEMSITRKNQQFVQYYNVIHFCIILATCTAIFQFTHICYPYVPKHFLHCDIQGTIMSISVHSIAVRFFIMIPIPILSTLPCGIQCSLCVIKSYMRHLYFEKVLAFYQKVRSFK